LGPALDQLLKVASGPLSPISYGFHLPGGNRFVELSDLLSVADGFYAFESALHVRPSGGAPPRDFDLTDWNRPELWRSAYGSMADGHFFFAEDAFGGQFTIRDNHIHTFDPETGDSDELAPTLEDWAAAILANYEVLTGSPLAHEWQVRNGPLAIGKRLVPKTPFVLGGDFEVENLFALDAMESMRYRGEIAVQLAEVPDGSSVKLRVFE
jgi:hypothetical protein